MFIKKEGVDFDSAENWQAQLFRRANTFFHYQILPFLFKLGGEKKKEYTDF